MYNKVLTYLLTYCESSLCLRGLSQFSQSCRRSGGRRWCRTWCP